MDTTTPEQGDLFAPEQLELFTDEKSPDSCQGFAIGHHADSTVAKRPDQPSSSEVRAGIAAT